MSKRFTVSIMLTTALLLQAAEPVRKGEDLKRSVLVELFTSEGCSSCPPADRILATIDHSQPFPGVEVIVLSEHVDYWNRLGWSDPFSSPAFSRRQEAYAGKFRTEGPYTPQMIVDGVTEFVGNDERRVKDAITEAGRRPKIDVRIAPITRTSGVVTIPLSVAALPSGGPTTARVHVALVEAAALSNVLRGENSGRKLAHVSVVREWKQAGTVTTSEPFEQTVSLKLKSNYASSELRVIAFVQVDGPGPVLGASVRSLK